MGLMDFPERHRPIGRPPVFGWRGLVAYTALLALMSAALYLIFIFAPAERVQGDVQRLLSFVLKRVDQYYPGHFLWHVAIERLRSPYGVA